MESASEINFLLPPKISPENLKYINQVKEVYVNLFEILIHKELKLFQYPYKVEPQIDDADLQIRDKLFKSSNKKLKEIYGECFISGDSLYSLTKITEIKEVKSKIFLKGALEYIISFQPFSKEKTIKQEDIQKDQLTKTFIEIIIRDILHSNPRLEFYKGLFFLKDQKKRIETEKVSVDFYPGFTTSFMETAGGNYLNVTLKNKIISTDNVLDFLSMNKYYDRRNQERIKDLLIGRSFKVSYAKKNYKIDDIIFDRNPKNQYTHLEGGKSVSLLEYYQTAHNMKITDSNQPLLLVKRNGPQNKELKLYFVPEFCFLAGLDDNAIKDGQFMKQLANYTKLNPEDRIEKTNDFIELLKDETRDPDNKEKLSAKEKSELYGIEVRPLDKLFKAYYMEETQLIGGGNKYVRTNERVFPVSQKKDMEKWVCFYEQSNYNDAENLFKSLLKASKGFGFNICEPEWVEMQNKSSLKDWIDSANEYTKENEYDFVVFLLGKNDYLYPSLKKHSLCKNGYVSQVVKARSLKKNSLSVCSKLLLQINAKLQGTSYKTKIDKELEGKQLMIIGADTSHIKGKRTGVAMVSSINGSFTNFYNKEIIIEEEKREQLHLCISSFIEEASLAYQKENGSMPKGIIIYRQGVSPVQKDFLKNEIKEIDSVCKTKNLLFYYILVNTKTTYKFFEKGGKSFNNPSAGLLILDGITNRNYFEFFIQPQEVTGGSATPTCFHVAFGNLDIPEMIPKLTYDLCHIYSNWQGAVRVPNVIKSAEKLSKMTAKYTFDELHPALKKGQSYL